MEIIGLDFETYAETDLLERGLENYVTCPYFQVLLAAVHTKDHAEVLDFVHDAQALDRLKELIEGRMVAAHNAGFEHRVLRRLGIDLPWDRIIDTAAVARAAGAGGKLEAAAPQLLGVDKMESGAEDIKLFSIPGSYQEFDGAFNPAVVRDYPLRWDRFISYCALDAELSYRLATEIWVPHRELEFSRLTMRMNAQGWHVDTALVEAMWETYQRNLDNELHAFRARVPSAADLNLASPIQVKQWCAQRGVVSDSFDEKHVAKLLKEVGAQLESTSVWMSPKQRADFKEVQALLKTKQMLGGSSLKKLPVIRAMTDDEGLLRNQYLHCGAGATFRTTGVGVQMQNLKRLNGSGDDVGEVLRGLDWPNDMMAANLRQVFTSSHPQGHLIVGDFSSVESRGLAWMAGEQWKLAAYTQGRGVYEEQAAKFYHIETQAVTKQQRTMGKVGELSCGYGAGPGAVRSFAEGMGLSLSQQEASSLVSDWRRINPRTVQFWHDLEKAFRAAVSHGAARVLLPEGTAEFTRVKSPESLWKQTGWDYSIRIGLHSSGVDVIRIVHGVHVTAQGISYYKPSKRKTGDLWTDRYTDPKTHAVVKYSLYGGKLAGLLTQSLCREVFFHVLAGVNETFEEIENVRLIGQFHDEIVLDWTPGDVTLGSTKYALKSLMSDSPLKGFPLAAEVKSDYRYIK